METLSVAGRLRTGQPSPVTVGSESQLRWDAWAGRIAYKAGLMGSTGLGIRLVLTVQRET